jgi:hypothetical protein
MAPLAVVGAGVGHGELTMTWEDFRQSLTATEPPAGLSRVHLVEVQWRSARRALHLELGRPRFALRFRKFEIRGLLAGPEFGGL